MNEKPAPRHVTRFVEELVECGVQLARMLDHMYLHENSDPDSPPPPEVLRDLAPDDFDGPFDTPLNEQLPDDPFTPPGEGRLH